MKSLRVLLLILLALLLPVRGAMAAVMLCPQGAQAGAALTMTVPHGDGVAAAAAHHHHAATHGPADAHAGGATHGSGCHTCASFCSMTPMPAAVPPLRQPTIGAAWRYPALTVPAPSFLSDGQERPPRSL